MEKQLFLIDVDDTIDGVTAISLVNNPAMRTQWLTFSEEKPVEVVLFDMEKQIIASSIINVGMRIPRMDRNGNVYEIAFSKEATERIAYKYMSDKRQNEWNIEHNNRNKVNAVTLVESYIVDREKGKGVPKGHEFVADGSWYGFAKVNDPELWKDIKEGKYRGFSLEGVLYEIPEKDIVTEVAELLEKLL